MPRVWDLLGAIHKEATESRSRRGKSTIAVHVDALHTPRARDEPPAHRKGLPIHWGASSAMCSAAFHSARGELAPERRTVGKALGSRDRKLCTVSKVEVTDALQEATVFGRPIPGRPEWEMWVIGLRVANVAFAYPLDLGHAQGLAGWRPFTITAIYNDYSQLWKQSMRSAAGEWRLLRTQAAEAEYPGCLDSLFAKESVWSTSCRARRTPTDTAEPKPGELVLNCRAFGDSRLVLPRHAKFNSSLPAKGKIIGVRRYDVDMEFGCDLEKDKKIVRGITKEALLRFMFPYPQLQRDPAEDEFNDLFEGLNGGGEIDLTAGRVQPKEDISLDPLSLSPRDERHSASGPGPQRPIAVAPLTLGSAPCVEVRDGRPWVDGRAVPDEVLVAALRQYYAGRQRPHRPSPLEALAESLSSDFDAQLSEGEIDEPSHEGRTRQRQDGGSALDQGGTPAKKPRRG